MSLPTQSMQELLEFAADHEAQLREAHGTSVRETSGGLVDCAKVAETLMRAEERGAVSGRLQVDDLLGPELSEPERLQVLSHLTPSFVVTNDAAGARWSMLAEPRAAQLRRMLNARDLSNLPPELLPPTDRAGDMLRRVLREGRAIACDALSLDELVALGSALDMLEGVSVPGPDRTHVAQLLARRRYFAQRDSLLTAGFVGRDSELVALRSFLKRTEHKLQSLWSGLVLTGLGGSGKSTLLAQFARDAADQTAATVLLDFDRAGIDPNDTHWLEMEVARQVGFQHVELASALHATRVLARKRKEQSDEVASAFTARRREFERSRNVITQVRDQLERAGVAHLPLLLMLDTFEEVARRDLEARVLDWLYEVARQLGSTPLKVIFSGRLFEATPPVLHTYAPTRTLELGAFDPPTAERFLLMRQVPAECAHRLAHSDVLPRRPLELKLLARLVTDGRTQSLDALEEELRTGGPSTAELFAGIVYRRVLLRIDDATTRKLAYPGLILRFVTPDLVRRVLGPALDLPPLDEAQAEEALARLTSYDWLVETVREHEVWHRRDLRRSMLKAAIANDVECARRIQELAVAYFRERGDPRARAEATYNRLMLLRSPDDGDDMELATLRQASPYIALDTEDLPPAAASLLRFATGFNITAADVRNLPARYQRLAYHLVGALSTNAREFRSALALFHQQRGQVDAPPSEDLSDWETETLFATASWNDLVHPPVVSVGERGPLHDLMRYAFPAGLIAPETIDPATLDALLVATFDAPLLAMPRAQMQTMLSRLAMCLVVHAALRPLSMGMHHALARLTHLTRSFDRFELRILDPRLRLFRLLQSQPLPDDEDVGVVVSPVTMTLNPAWLRILRAPNFGALTEAGLPQAAQTFLSILASIIEDNDNGRHSVRRTLAELNALSAQDHGLKIGYPVLQRLWSRNADSTFELVRGPDHEFRDPCRFALLEQFQDPHDLPGLAEIFASVIPLRPYSISSDVFVASVESDPEHALEGYVELADRCGALSELMARASKHGGSPRLDAVRLAYDRWSRALRSVYANALSTPHSREVS